MRSNQAELSAALVSNLAMAGGYWMGRQRGSERRWPRMDGLPNGRCQAHRRPCRVPPPHSCCAEDRAQIGLAKQIGVGWGD